MAMLVGWFLLISSSVLWVAAIPLLSNSSLASKRMVEAPVWDTAMDLFTFESNAEVSKTCSAERIVYLNALKNGDMWALKMLDASSKLQSGLMSLNLADLGAFDQCIEINAVGNIHGKYCLASFIPMKSRIKQEMYSHSQMRTFQNMLPSIKRIMGHPISMRDNDDGPDQPNDLLFLILRRSVCVPNGCTTQDVISHLNQSLSSNGLSFTLQLNDDDCQTMQSQNKLRQADWWFIAFLIVILFAMLACTGYDIHLQRTQQKTKHQILLTFSWYTNGKKYLAINNGPDQLPCLHGLRFISMMWVVLGHQYGAMAITPLVNFIDVIDWLKTWPSLYTTGSTVSVDTFFVLSGCLLMYGFMKTRAKGLPFNIPLFYLHRYLRLTPALIVVILFHLTLIRVVGSGPLYHTVADPMRESCEKWWWTSLLYVQNYVNPQEICVGQTWYLQVDMQLFWLSPLVLWPCAKWRRYAPYYLTILIVIFTAISTYVAGYYQFDATFIHSVIDPEYMPKYYFATHTRACTWLVGIALGYFMFRIKDKRVKLSKIMVLVGWLIAAIILLYVLFGTFPNLDDNYKYEPIYNTMFVGLHRTFWALGISWIIFACVHGYGGPVNLILSLPIFQVLGRLTYCMYLTHMTMEQLRSGVARTQVHFSDLDVWFVFWGSFVFDVIIAIVWIMAFEAPMITIDTLLFSIGKRKKPVVKQTAPTNGVQYKIDPQKKNDDLMDSRIKPTPEIASTTL